MAELETIPEEEYDEDGEERGEVLDVSHKVNEDVTLYQTELCVMYNCLHWERHSHYTGWNNVEIKQIVGHAMLRLNYDEYDGLNLEDVIERLRNEKDVLTELVKVPAEKLKKNWVNWIPKLHEKYVNMCRNDKKLAKQRDDERRIHRPEENPSISVVLAGSSSGSHGG